MGAETTAYYYKTIILLHFTFLFCKGFVMPPAGFVINEPVLHALAMATTIHAKTFRMHPGPGPPPPAEREQVIKSRNETVVTSERNNGTTD